MKSKDSNTYRCIISGKEKYIPPSLAKNKIKRFGSKEEYKKYYVCKEAGKLIKAGKTVDEVRDILSAPTGLPVVNIQTLLRLKLTKLTTRRDKRDTLKEQQNRAYLKSNAFREKIIQHNLKYVWDNDKDYVRWATGGEDGQQAVNGGTCIRPDIRLSTRDKVCDSCQAYEHCMVYDKRLSGDKRKKKR